LAVNDDVLSVRCLTNVVFIPAIVVLVRLLPLLGPLVVEVF
jgi:hypothetical protein